MGGGTACTIVMLQAGKECIVKERHPSVFQMSGSFDAPRVTVALLFVIGFTVVVESAIHRIEHSLAAKAMVWSEMGNKVGKELMILGSISFAIFIGNQAFYLNETAFFLPLEFAHILILGIALFYVRGAWLHLRSIRTTCTRYDRLLALPPRAIEEKFRAQWGTRAQDPQQKPYSLWERLRWRNSDLCAAVELQILRTVFVVKHSLSPDFDFGAYLRHALEERVGTTLDITKLSWLLLGAEVLICWGAGTALGLNVQSAFLWLTVLGWVGTAVHAWVLHIALRGRGRLVALCLDAQDPKGVDLSPRALTSSALGLVDGLVHGSATRATDEERHLWLDNFLHERRSSASSSRAGLQEQQQRSPPPDNNPVARKAKRPSVAPIGSVLLGAAAGAAGAAAAGARPHHPSRVRISEHDSSHDLRHYESSAMADHVADESSSVVLRWEIHSPEGFRTFPVRRRYIRRMIDFLFLGDCAFKAVLYIFYFDVTRQSWADGDWTCTVLFILCSVATAINTYVLLPRMSEVFQSAYSAVRIEPNVLAATQRSMASAEKLRRVLLRKLHEYRALQVRDAAVAAVAQQQQQQQQQQQHKEEEEEEGIDGEWLRAQFDAWASTTKAGGNHLHRDQLNALLCTLGIEMDKYRFGKLMRLIDPDQSNSIDYGEFINFLCPPSAAASGGGDAAGHSRGGGLFALETRLEDGSSGSRAPPTDSLMSKRSTDVV